MTSWMKTACLGLALAVSDPVIANAQSTHDYWMLIGSDHHGPLLNFVDVASVTQTGGQTRRYWETTFYRDPWTLRLSGEVRSMVSLSEVNCATSEFRALAIIAYDRRGSAVIHNNEPTDWNFAPPHTRISDTISLVCNREQAPDERWAHYGDVNPLREGERTFGSQ